VAWSSPTFDKKLIAYFLEDDSSLGRQDNLGSKFPLMQRCHKGRFWRKITVRTSFSSGRPRTSSGRPRLPRGRGFTRRRVFTVRGRGKNRVRADARVRPCGHERVSADAAQHPRGREIFGLERESFNFQFSIFNFWFSIPKIPKIPKISKIPKLPKLPELRGLRGRSSEKKKVFSA
jgi:hypothetical protein